MSYVWHVLWIIGLITALFAIVGRSPKPPDDPMAH